ncbi:MAG: hypothetical protein CML06_12185 [Pseudomonadales bacterium]|nr:hypothetical protein [Pseudomonadales bacterium]
MEEARNIKSTLYPLARDLRTLKTCVANIHNILQAEPEPFAPAAPPGLAALRNTLRQLSRSLRLLQQCNETAVAESAQAEKLAQRAMTLVLRPAARLHDGSLRQRQPLERAINMAGRLNGYLNPLFVFTVSVAPVVQLMLRDLEALDQRLARLKKAINRASDEELTRGLPPRVEEQLAILAPRLKNLQRELADIGYQMGLLMGRMNRLAELSARLEPVLRIALTLDRAVEEVAPAMVSLQRLSRALTSVEARYDRESSLTMQVNAALEALDLPMDILLQLESRLLHAVEDYVNPTLPALQDLTDYVKLALPRSWELNSLEGALLTQHTRFDMTLKTTAPLFDGFDRALHLLPRTSHVA